MGRKSLHAGMGLKTYLAYKQNMPGSRSHASTLIGRRRQPQRSTRLPPVLELTPAEELLHEYTTPVGSNFFRPF